MRGDCGRSFGSYHCRIFREIQDSLSSSQGYQQVGLIGGHGWLPCNTDETHSNTYYVYAGTYTEQVSISRANVMIYGETTAATSYTGNKATITNNVPASTAGSNDASGTVRILATGVKIYNLNIANTYGKVGILGSMCHILPL